MRNSSWRNQTETAFPTLNFDRIIQINLVGTFRCIAKSAAGMMTLPALEHGERGAIVNTASVAAQDGQIGQASYSASKAGSDLLVRAYYHTHGFPACITRCSNNYGPYQFPEKLIPLMVVNALNDRPLPVYGDGTNGARLSYSGAQRGDDPGSRRTVLPRAAGGATP